MTGGAHRASSVEADARRGPSDAVGRAGDPAATAAPAATATAPAAPAAPAPLVVAMLTYRRPQDVRAAVPAFLAELGTVDVPGELLVVDNDPDAGARDTVEGVGDPRVRYVHEPRPGIAAGRNRALAECADRDVLVFVDDDERPRPGWLAALLAEHARSGAAAVVGAVVSDYERPPDGWLAAGRFFDRRRLPTGTVVDVAATNNLLLDLGRLRPTGLTFDERFGLSGGSDTLFSRRLVAAGERMVWCDEAVVVDHVPADRLTRAWVLRRAYRSGNSGARAEVVLATGLAQLAVRARYVARGLVRVVGGSARVALGAVTRSDVHDARGRRSVQRGRGMVAGALGHVVYEYRRQG